MLGAVALVAAFAVGLVAFVIFLVAAVVLVSFLGLRLWWLQRRWGRRNPPRRPTSSGDVIDAEYEVLARNRKSE